MLPSIKVNRAKDAVHGLRCKSSSALSSEVEIELHFTSCNNLSASVDC